MMRRRCDLPTVRCYPNYGGRGIYVCERWHKFENFYADMGPRPSTDHQIDRIDNDGPYSPENCRWATRIENMSHRRTSRLLTFEGETMSLAEWSRRVGLTTYCIFYRLDKMGWSVEQALTTPSLRPRKPKDAATQA